MKDFELMLYTKSKLPLLSVVVKVDLVVKCLVVDITLVMTTSWVVGNNMFFILRFSFGGFAASISAWRAPWLDNTASNDSACIVSVTINGDTAS